MRRKIVGVISILFMALMVAVPVCALAAKDTIKLGVTDPFSGSFKDIGDRYLEGVVYAAKVINESGGLLGKKVEVVPIDSELKPDVATRKAHTLLLKDGVKFFCGGTGSSVGAAMEQFAEKNNAIFFTYGMMAASMTGVKCSKNFFRVTSNTDQYSGAMAELIKKKGYKRVAIIAQDYSYGQESVTAFKKKFSEISPAAKIVAELFHPIGSKDFAPYISQLIAANPDVIFTPNFGNDLSLFLKQGRPMGMKQIVVCITINDEVIIEALGDDNLMIGNMGGENYTLSIPTKKNQEFVTNFYKDKGHYPTWLRGKSYIATMFWAEAVKKAGTTDIDAVIKAWEGLTYDGPAGLWTMRACDHQVQAPMWFTEIVKENKFFKHAFEVSAGMTTAKSIEIPCEQTGCKMKK